MVQLRTSDFVERERSAGQGSREGLVPHRPRFRAACTGTRSGAGRSMARPTGSSSHSGRSRTGITLAQGQLPYDAESDQDPMPVCGGWFRFLGGQHIRRILNTLDPSGN